MRDRKFVLCRRPTHTLGKPPGADCWAVFVHFPTNYFKTTTFYLPTTVTKAQFNDKKSLL